jgi:hypothetical protein
MADLCPLSSVGVKFPADVGVVKRSSMKIGRLHRNPGSESAKESSPAPRRFAMRISKVERAVLRQSECRFHGWSDREKSTRQQLDRTESIYIINAASLGLFGNRNFIRVNPRYSTFSFLRFS